MEGRVAYRKLPGHRRGFFRSSSVWLGPDHLLAVRSMRFREEYKRYQLSDIQAIVVANRPRFHISTRSFGIAILWLIAFSILYQFPRGAILAWLAAVVLVGAWIYISAAASCTCRIYTAVSRDELPSVYRRWVARRFLRAVEPQIAAVQGTVEQIPGEALEAQDVGPPETIPRPSGQPVPAELSSSPEPRQHAMSFYFLLAGLFADGLWRWFALSHTIRWATQLTTLLPLLVMASAIFVLVQHHRRAVRAAQQKVAIVTLVVMGLLSYGTLVGMRLVTAFRAAATRQALDYAPSIQILSKLDIAVALALGLAGLVVLFTGGRDIEKEPGTIGL